MLGLERASCRLPRVVPNNETGRVMPDENPEEMLEESRSNSRALVLVLVLFSCGGTAERGGGAEGAWAAAGPAEGTRVARALRGEGLPACRAWRAAAGAGAWGGGARPWFGEGFRGPLGPGRVNDRSTALKERGRPSVAMAAVGVGVSKEGETREVDWDEGGGSAGRVAGAAGLLESRVVYVVVMVLALEVVVSVLVGRRVCHAVSGSSVAILI